jgi:hypothetical protein
MKLNIRELSPYIKASIYIGSVLFSLAWILSAQDANTKSLAARLDKIENNHLAHIQASLNDLSTRLTRVEAIIK